MRLAVLCSGNGTNFENILRSCWEDEVVIMIHNVENCGAVKRANKFGIPHCFIEHEDEDLMIMTLKAMDVDLIILAGYMRILSKRFVESFDNIINVHPSLLPKYKGLNTVQRALDAGDTVVGCTVHYVTEELDSGDIIYQGLVDVEPNDTVKTLTRKIQRQEYSILPEAIRLIKNYANT
jgi:formyltetrahydrofolate-dependent phosphoribosylglycinamide formyltransferase|tara:strand:- start:52 stop:588 length:537 start_codon:yes stop_codon:yes gene_type:complete